MATNQNDTDPLGAGVIQRADTEPQPAAAKPVISTDPGIGPASRPPAPAAVIPSAPPPPPAAASSPAARAPSSVRPARPARPTDSVDVLLEGMTGPQPERINTTPQTDGQASASYHAEHAVRPAHTDPEAEPKVVVEPRRLPPTMRIDRSKLPMGP